MLNYGFDLRDLENNVKVTNVNWGLPIFINDLSTKYEEFAPYCS